MSAREDLEAQLDAAPHDASAFLVYADWLLEHGEAHGELIRVQHALASAPRDLALLARETQLTQQLLPALSGFSLRWELGFPRAVTLSWVPDRYSEAVSSGLRSPLCRFVEKVTLSDYVSAARIAGALQPLQHLHEVHLHNDLEFVSTQEALQLLDAVKGLKHLRRLGLRARAVDVLLPRLPAFSVLQELKIEGAHLRGSDLAVFETARGILGSRCRLRLSRTGVSFDFEAQLMERWPFKFLLEGAGLLVEEPRDYRGAFLQAGERAVNLGEHVACDLRVELEGIRSVHAALEGSTLREVGYVDAPARQLSDGDRVTFGRLVMRYCEDLAGARELLRRG